MQSLSSRAHRFGAATARVAAVLAVVTAASTASAEPDFPGIIQETFGSSCAPQCTLCHTSPQGGADTVKMSAPDGKYVDGAKPSHRGFGVFIANLSALPPVGNPSTKTLATKLKELKGHPCQTDSGLGDTSDTGDCDSDGDGMSDYDELAAQPARDPDVFGEGNGAICPAYGCGASIGTLPRDADTSGRAGAVMAALGVALVLGRRLRRR